MQFVQVVLVILLLVALLTAVLLLQYLLRLPRNSQFRRTQHPHFHTFLSVRIQ
jgi:hypothetical protein